MKQPSGQWPLQMVPMPYPLSFPATGFWKRWKSYRLCGRPGDQKKASSFGKCPSARRIAIRILGPGAVPPDSASLHRPSFPDLYDELSLTKSQRSPCLGFGGRKERRLSQLFISLRRRFNKVDVPVFTILVDNSPFTRIIAPISKPELLLPPIPPFHPW